MAHRRDTYTPGNVVRGYGGVLDKVLDYETLPDGAWRVQVQELGKDGQPAPETRPRWHSTEPGKGYEVVSRDPAAQADADLKEIAQRKKGAAPVEGETGSLFDDVPSAKRRIKKRLMDEKGESGFGQDEAAGLFDDLVTVGRSYANRTRGSLSKWRKGMIAEFGPGVGPRLPGVWRAVSAPVKPVKTLFHGTSSVHLDSIRKDGLLPEQPGKGKPRKGVYVSPFAAVAAQEGANTVRGDHATNTRGSGGEEVLLALDRRQARGLEIDPEYSEGRRRDVGSLISKRAVPASAIKGVYRGEQEIAGAIAASRSESGRLARASGRFESSNPEAVEAAKKRIRSRMLDDKGESGFGQKEATGIFDDLVTVGRHRSSRAGVGWISYHPISFVRAETNAQHWLAALDGFGDQADLLLEVRQIVVGGHRTAHEDQAVTAEVSAEQEVTGFCIILGRVRCLDDAC